MDRLNRANICACAAVGADSRVNYVNVTFSNGLNRALIDTGSASSTVFVNYISHGY